jgi:hypothetical protein
MTTLAVSVRLTDHVALLVCPLIDCTSQLCERTPGSSQHKATSAARYTTAERLAALLGALWPAAMALGRIELGTNPVTVGLLSFCKPDKLSTNPPHETLGQTSVNSLANTRYKIPLNESLVVYAV